MPKRVGDYRATLRASLTDPQEAAAYLEAALEASKEMFLVALRDVAESRQMSKVAEEAGVAREAFYRILNETGNPTLTTLTSVRAWRSVENRSEGRGVAFRLMAPLWAIAASEG